MDIFSANLLNTLNDSVSTFFPDNTHICMHQNKNNKENRRLIHCEHYLSTLFCYESDGVIGGVGSIQ